jgi:hypothetical protein
VKNIATCATLGLTIIAGSLGIAAPASADSIIFKNYVNEGICMGVSGANTTPGTPIIVWQCQKNTPNQEWAVENLVDYFGLEEIPNMTELNNLGGSYTSVLFGWSYQGCLDTQDGEAGNGAQLILSGCSGQIDEGFSLVWVTNDSSGNACYHIVDAKSGRLVGVSGGSQYVRNGTRVILWDDLGHPDQIWCGETPP